MDNKLNSVPSVGTEVENSTKVEVSSVNQNDTKPIVGCSATLSNSAYPTTQKFYDENGKLVGFITLVAQGELPVTGQQYLEWHRQKFGQ